MKNKISKKIMLSVVSLALVAAMALGFSACGNDSTQNPEGKPPVQDTSDITEIGQGQRSFAFEVTDKDGSVEKFLVKTDSETVGDALSKCGLISGETGQYGLIVDTVNGVKYDYTADGMYWAFYVNGEYATAGVDSTPIDETAVYAFTATKA